VRVCSQPHRQLAGRRFMRNRSLWANAPTSRRAHFNMPLRCRMRSSMNSLSEPAKETARHERAISSLHARTGAPLVEVRRLFAQEFSRLELEAKVRSYLSVLTARNVGAILRRKGVSSQEESDA
jgi:hypothetical protein